MGSIYDLIAEEKIPRMLRVHQKFCSEHLTEFEAAFMSELSRLEILEKICPDMKIVITAGSREIDHMADAVRILGRVIRSRGASPYVIPAMGSHGGATAEGQKDILTSYGITEENTGVPVYSSMEVVPLTKLPDGNTVFIDKFAYEADGIIVLNRIKAHTGFRAPYESGLHKMMAVGLGKQKGAEMIHSYGPMKLGQMVEQVGRAVLNNAKILFGVALVENAYDETHTVRCLTKEEIVTEEPKLLLLSKSMMPKIYFENLDVLIVDRIGKNISGSGMDPNITKNYNRFTGMSREGKAKRIVVFDLSDETHGCAIGIGGADITTKRVLEKMDIETTYPSCLTCFDVESPCVPMAFDNQQLAVKAAIKTLHGVDKEHLRMVRIKDTLHLGEIEVSEDLLPEAVSNPDIEVLSEPRYWEFNENGDLF